MTSLAPAFPILAVCPATASSSPSPIQRHNTLNRHHLSASEHLPYHTGAPKILVWGSSRSSSLVISLHGNHLRFPITYTVIRFRPHDIIPNLLYQKPFPSYFSRTLSNILPLGMPSIPLPCNPILPTLMPPPLKRPSCSSFLPLNLHKTASS